MQRLAILFYVSLCFAIAFVAPAVLGADQDWSLPLASLKTLALSTDLQWIRHPGYNSDRGPVFVWLTRVHVEIE